MLCLSRAYRLILGCLPVLHATLLPMFYAAMPVPAYMHTRLPPALCLPVSCHELAVACCLKTCYSSSHSCMPMAQASSEILFSSHAMFQACCLLVTVQPRHTTATKGSSTNETWINRDEHFDFHATATTATHSCLQPWLGWQEGCWHCCCCMHSCLFCPQACLKPGQPCLSVSCFSIGMDASCWMLPVFILPVSPAVEWIQECHHHHHPSSGFRRQVIVVIVASSRIHARHFSLDAQEG